MKPSVSGNYVQAILAHLQGEGVPLSKLRRGAGPGLDCASTGRSVQRVAPETICRMFDYWSAELDRPALGLEFGLAVSPSGMGLLGAVARSAPDLNTALRASMALLPMQSTATHVRLEIVDSVASIVWEPRVPGLSAHFVEAAVSTWVRLLRSFSDEPVPIIVVEFAHVRQDTSALERGYRCAVRFGCARHRILFPRDTLALTSAFANPELHHRLLRLCGGPNGQAWAPANGELVGVIDRVSRGLDAGSLTVAEVARHRHVGSRTLQRRLQQMNLTFRRTLEAVRAGVAVAELFNEVRSVTEVAEAARFSEHSAFTRAFRRWTGLSPTGFRRHFQSRSTPDHGSIPASTPLRVLG